MARLPRKKSESGIYHVLLRGINQQRVFEDDKDFEKFIFYIGQVKEASACKLLAYCLMSNHVHLLMEEGTEQLGFTLRRLAVRYVMYFNGKYQRVGQLFQDRFQSEPVETDAYFTTVLRYILHNPVKAGLCDRPEEYAWSSQRASEEADSIIDTKRLGELCDINAVLTNAGIEDSESALDIRNPKRCGKPDSEASMRLEKISKASSAAAFQTFDKSLQQPVVLQLLSEGFSIRQVARICGLSKGLVESWKRASRKTSLP